MNEKKQHKRRHTDDGESRPPVQVSGPTCETQLLSLPDENDPTDCASSRFLASQSLALQNSTVEQYSTLRTLPNSTQETDCSTVQ